MLIDDGRKRRDRSDNPFAQRDDREETVALGDVVRVPRSASIFPFGERGPREFDERKDGAERECAQRRQTHSDPDMQSYDSETGETFSWGRSDTISDTTWVCGLIHSPVNDRF